MTREMLFELCFAAAVWALNSFFTTVVVKLPPQSPWIRAIRALHGVLDRNEEKPQN